MKMIGKEEIVLMVLGAIVGTIVLVIGLNLWEKFKRK